ncbi:MAG: electron transport complex subunit E [Chromatiales bacterium]|nr:electron transport complex subunit E [Gammaproteobacteria bacterium]MBW6477644.1 electron transport complex subunit E [Chromatiales bacterium]
MAEAPYQKIAGDGLWYNNVALVQILGLCPLLAVTSTAVNGIGLGLATMLVLLGSSVTVSLIRHLVRPEIRIPVYVVIIASFVTAVELSIRAWFHDLYLVLGIFIPLIVTNCAILGRAEAFASKNSVPRAALDALTMGFGFLVVLFILGAMREMIGFGTLFAQANLMFGEAFSWMTITLFEDYRGFLIAILPPGAFIGLGLLIAVKNIIDARLERRRKQAIARVPAELPGQA